jgi:hypothetical protein
MSVGIFPSNAKTLIPHFMKIGQLVPEIKGTRTQVASLFIFLNRVTIRNRNKAFVRNAKLNSSVT